MERLISFLGLFVMVGIAVLLSENRKKLDYRTIIGGILLQFALGAAVLWSAPGRLLFDGANSFVLRIIQFSNAGAEMVFGAKYADHFFAFAVLPSIIFFSSLMAILFYLGIMQWIVRGYSWVMHKTMRISGAEAMAASANVFVGGVEAAFTVRPYVAAMTRSEIMTLSVAGMATIAGGVMAAFAGLGIDAGHLLAAQLMSATAAILVAKIMIPEVEKPKTRGLVKIEIEKNDVNVFDAACRGALDGIRVAATVAAVLIAFVALTSMLNFGFSLLPPLGGASLSVERVLGFCFKPLVFLTGAPWAECGALGALLGKKMFLNEFMAFLDLSAMKSQLSPRSVMLATYFLCGFANFSVVAMQIGGMSSLWPERRKTFAQLALKSMIGGTLASLMSACVAGVLV